MARPITLTAPVRDRRQELVEKLERAPAEHAAALLDGYEFVEQLHERGIFTVLCGALRAGDKLTDAAAGAIDSPEVIDGLRTLIVLGKALAGIDPLVARSFAKALDETMSDSALAAEPPSLVSLLAQFRRRDVRRGLALVSHFLGALGRESSSVQIEKKGAHRGT